MDIVRLSENTVIILFEQQINHENFSIINRITRIIKIQMSDVIVDVIPSYASIHITFNVLKISSLNFKNSLERLVAESDSLVMDSNADKLIEIPVYYGEEVALDLHYIAEKAQLTHKQVIEIHSSKIYDVYAIGFSPGFAYLGNVDDAIACPRKTTPRQKVLQGSLGIADQQTAIYPTDSPGGWQIIGRTPIQLIDYNSERLTPFSTGDKVKFNPMSKSDFMAMGGSL